jgi:hypothetical protein
MLNWKTYHWKLCRQCKTNLSYWLFTSERSSENLVILTIIIIITTTSLIVSLFRLYWYTLIRMRLERVYTWIIKNSRSRDQYILARTISIDFFISECQTFHFDRQHIRCLTSDNQNDLHLIITIQFSLSIFSDSSSVSVCIFLVFWTSVLTEKCYVVFRRRARSYSLNQFSCIDLSSSHHSMI